ncbi:GTPase HflX [Chitinibacter bivalviorum]|uniref:GTPase HflX n=1 Tax=Chitinibacter bivalviorum TaxID=2739434 RepID=A0A7H9BH24_9NEIS|nr:GTPase HflX [Chitinibacter bivalviorum]QLG87917.1 GTPase HflX [Chitinibacter bivalviorum]
MFERHQGGDEAILVCLDFGEADYRDGIDEFVELVKSAGVKPLQIIEGKRQRPDPAYFCGSGKADEIALAVSEHQAQLVIFNHQLSPAQERNLEKKVQCRVLDRTTLILDIFAQRARTAEGKLQVELAQLAHIQTRLIRGWTHLERQKGGVGLRGPGESQLETDRRLIGIRVKRLKDQLVVVQKQRATQRKARDRNGQFTVSIVGYTNAGKSTLFNALTKAKIYVADQLFATLDTTSRKLYLDAEHSIVLSDTVGFIRQLPHTLVAAFRATLEETINADVLLHVVDINHPMRELQISEVNKVLHEIGAEHIPQLMVFNKIDQKSLPPEIVRDEYDKIQEVKLSAIHGDGLDLLRAALIEAMSQSQKEE